MTFSGSLAAPNSGSSVTFFIILDQNLVVTPYQVTQTSITPKQLTISKRESIMVHCLPSIQKTCGQREGIPSFGEAHHYITSSFAHLYESCRRFTLNYSAYMPVRDNQPTT